MPELPEVETIRLTLLHKGILGKQIKKVFLPESRLLKSKFDLENRKKFITSFTGETISKLARHGKYLIIQGKKHALVLHLGMSGVIHWKDHPYHPIPHLYLRLTFNNKEELLFTDPRTFGRLIPIIHSNNKIKRWDIDFALGPDALLTPSKKSAQRYWEKSQNSIRPIKSILLDQSILAGIGNIYADETLFLSQLSPLRPGLSLTIETWQYLSYNLKKVFRKALQAGGSTLSHYRRPNGLSGNFQNQFTVYGKSGKPCPQCSKPLKKILIQSRTSVYCSFCQK